MQLLLCVLSMGAASGFHSQRPEIRSARAPRRAEPLRAASRTGEELEERTGEELGERRPTPLPDVYADHTPTTRRDLLDATVYSGIFFYLGGLYGHMRTSDFEVAVQALRSEIEQAAEEQRPQQMLGADARAANVAASRAGIERSRDQSPIYTLAVCSAFMWLLGVICSPVLLPLFDGARHTLGETEPNSFKFPARWWRQANQGATQAEGAAAAAGQNIAIHRKPLEPAAEPSARSAVLRFEAPADDVKAGRVHNDGGSLKTTISMPRLPLRPTGHPGGGLPLCILKRTRLQISLPLLRPRELYLLAVLGVLIIVSSVAPAFGIAGVRFTLTRV
jgi:hypothetical protein